MYKHFNIHLSVSMQVLCLWLYAKEIYKCTYKSKFQRAFSFAKKCCYLQDTSWGAAWFYCLYLLPFRGTASCNHFGGEIKMGGKKVFSALSRGTDIILFFHLLPVSRPKSETLQLESPANYLVKILRYPHAAEFCGLCAAYTWVAVPHLWLWHSNHNEGNGNSAASYQHAHQLANGSVMLRRSYVGTWVPGALLACQGTCLWSVHGSRVGQAM